MSTPVWVVTGASGFLGGAILRHLLADPTGRRVVACVRGPGVSLSGTETIRLDLNDSTATARCFGDLRPDVVIHAAGATPPVDSSGLYRANTRATGVLLDALDRLGKPIRVVAIGSAAELGPVPADRLPIAEDCPCRPDGPYGLSKWAGTRLALEPRRNLTVLAARVFNPIGPGQSASQVFGRVARLLASSTIETPTIPRLDPRLRRDFLDSRDVAAAVVRMAERGRAGLYHVGSGRSVALAEGVERLVALSGRRVDWAPGGAWNGPLDSIADVRRIRAEVGWSPRIDFEASLADLWTSALARQTGLAA